MKNKFIALALVTLSIATTTVSCSKDDAIPSAKAQDIKTAKLTIPVKVEDGTSISGKSVTRGTLPVSIDEIDVTVTSTQFTWTNMTPFVLTDALAGTVTPYGTVEGSFNLTNVAVGNNNISAITSTQAQPSISSAVSTDAAETLLANLKLVKPYAVYTGGVNGVVVSQTQPNVLANPIALTTKNGRNIAVFKLSDELKALGVTARITALPSVNSSVGTFATIDVTADNNGDIYWNNTAENDAKLLYTVTLLDHNGVALPTENQIPLPQYGNFFLANHPSISTNTIYTIKQGALVPQTVTQQFTATWKDLDGTGSIGND